MFSAEMKMLTPPGIPLFPKAFQACDFIWADGFSR